MTKKTHGWVLYKDDPDDTELSAHYFRYDIGDYAEQDSGLYNHINNFWENAKTSLGRGDYVGVTQEDIDDSYGNCTSKKIMNKIHKDKI